MKTGYSLRQRGDAIEIRYDIGRDPATGRRKTASVNFKGSLRDAHREARRRLGERDLSLHIDANKITMRDYLARWLHARRPSWAPSSYRHYRAIVEHHLVPALGNLYVAKLRPIDLADFYAGLRPHDGRDELSARTKRQIHSVLAQALGRAVEDQVAARNPTDTFRRRQPKVEPPEMQIINPAQQLELIEAARGSRIFMPIVLALATGARLGEIVALRWRNVDFDRGLVTISGSISYDTGTLGPTKTGKSRQVTLPRFAIEALRRHRVEQAQERLACGVRIDNSDLFICPRVVGDGPSSRSISFGFARLLANMPASFPGIRFHDLRHSHATQLLREGVHAKVISERLGHSDIGITLRVYAHALPTMQREAADKLDAAFEALR